MFLLEGFAKIDLFYQGELLLTRGFIRKSLMERPYLNG